MTDDLAARPWGYIEFCAGAGQLGRGVDMAIAGARARAGAAAAHDDAGGVARGLEPRPVCYVEVDLAPAVLLAARIRDGALPDAPLWSNLKSFDAGAWRGLVDGIIGGYPCQPFSAAGKRLGVNDPRHLWPWIARHIRSVRPRWCFFENVGEHLRIGYHDVVRPDLEGLGYRVKEILLAASDVGAPHGRERLFILAVRVADAGGGGFGAVPAPAAEGSNAHDGDEGMGDGLADPEGAGLQGRSGRAGAQLAGSRQGGGSLAYARYGGWPPGPTDERAWRAILARRPDLAPATQSAVRGGADGLARGLDLSRSDRLRIIGNGVVPPQVAAAFTLLADELGLDLS